MEPERRRAPEAMDEPGVDPAELARGLSDLEAVNRWLGGRRVALAALAPLLRRVDASPVRVLDVATGAADIPLAVAGRARAAGLRVRVVATDAHPRTLELARARAAADPDVTVEAADALGLPYADGAFHLAMCHTALHHFDPRDAVRVLRELDRVATHGVVVTDLYRSWTGLAAVRLLAATVWRRHPVTRHDGPVSVRAAYTPEELVWLATEAGMETGRVRSWFLHNRMALVVDRTSRGAR